MSLPSPTRERGATFNLCVFKYFHEVMLHHLSVYLVHSKPHIIDSRALVIPSAVCSIKFLPASHILSILYYSFLENIFCFLIIHMCIQCLGYVFPHLLFPSCPPTPSLPGKNYFAFISNFFEERV
jgi:hypothetical protein